MEYNTSVKIYSLSPMMSVASQTKTKMTITAFLSMMVVWARLPVSANTSLGYSFVPTTTSSESMSSDQDLSVLREKLKERFWEITTDVRGLVGWTASPSTSWKNISTSMWDMSKPIPIQSILSYQNMFGDIDDDPYQSYINRLGAYGVLTTASKFYPQNYFRIDDFVGLIQKLFVKKTGQKLTDPDVIGLTWEDGMMTKRLLQQTMMALHLGTGIQLDGNPYDKLIRSEWAYYLVRMFDLPIIDIPVTSSTILPDAFTDIAWHPSAYAINTLANLGIVTTQYPKFYPDNYLRHYDFVMIFVNTYLTAKGKSLPMITTSLFADVPMSANYLAQLTYAADCGLIDHLITSRQWQLYFAPDDFMTKHEAYQIVAKALNLQLIYDQGQAEQSKISRGELATLLVNSFELQPTTTSNQTLSWVELDEEKMSLLSKLKTLISIL